MKLAIVSHTSHYITADGKPVGWGPTVREIDKLAPEFEQVFHLAFLHPGTPPVTALPYDSPNVKFIGLHPAGGPRIADKLRLIYYAWANLRTIGRVLSGVDAVQLRLPTGMGVYLLPWISWMVKRTFVLWVKYAGNWNQPSPPRAYAFQRWFLRKNFQKSVVTINGRWHDQPEHCLSFENPCLTTDELLAGKRAALQKDYNEKLTILFVGRIEAAKGVDKIFEMLLHMGDTRAIEKVILAGDGDPDRFRALASAAKVPFVFTGGVRRDRLNEFYATCHVLILPSASEGFPKVVAEAAAFGCVPAVSDVSSLSQYIGPDNGLLLKSLDPRDMARVFGQLLSDRAVLRSKAEQAIAMAEKFTYTYYNNRILREVIRPVHPAQ